MPRIRHIGGHGSILTAKMGHNGGPAWDPTGRRYAFEERYWGSGYDALGAIVVSPDGTRVFGVIGGGAGYRLRQYNLSVPYDVTSIISAGGSVEYNPSATLHHLGGLEVSPDGTRFILSTIGNGLVTVSCPTPWTLTGASHTTWNSGLTAHRFYMSVDGLTLYQHASSTIYKKTLATPWTLTDTGTVVTSLSEATFISAIPYPERYGVGSYFGGGRLSPDGKRFYGLALSGGIGYSVLWSADLTVPHDLFSGHVFRGSRQLQALGVSVGYPPSGFSFGDKGKSLFFSTTYDSTRGYLSRIKFAP